MKPIELEISGKKQKVLLQKVGQIWWAHVSGQTFTIDTLANVTRKTGETSAIEVNEILAPMPGKITKVLVKPGQKIKRHEILVVMEAMKMEYTLTAPRDTTASEVKVQAGAQVGVNTVLVRFKDE